MKAKLTTLVEALDRLPTEEGKRFATLVGVGDFSLEIYAPRGRDPQQPHTRDEIYIVARGSGEFVRDDERVAFAEGDVLFVAAHVPHRFENFSDDFVTWVIFYGEER